MNKAVLSLAGAYLIEHVSVNQNFRSNASLENDISEVTAPRMACLPSDHSAEWPMDNITGLIAASVNLF